MPTWDYRVIALAALDERKVFLGPEHVGGDEALEQRLNELGGEGYQVVAAVPAGARSAIILGREIPEPPGEPQVF